MQQNPLDLLQIDLWGRQRSHVWLRILYLLFIRRGQSCAVILIRLAQHYHQRGAARCSREARLRLQRDFGCYVQPTAEIGPGLRLPHPNGIVIGAGVRIGARCTIYHQVTLGGARRGDWSSDAYPTIGDDAVLFSGAKLLGSITLGDGVQVGANAVVLNDVPARHSAAGIPAKNRPLRA